MRKKINTYTFIVVRWDETGNKLLESFKEKVRRTDRFTAKNFLQNKYPKPYFVELNS